MGKNTKIEWADHTLNWWTGCTKVSPACANCYAESWSKRSGLVQWGKGHPRRLTSLSNRRQPLKWNAEARDADARPRVFVNSLSDTFDPEVSQEWRDELFGMIRATESLDYLLLTKWIELAAEMLPKDWGTGYPNVWIGTTVEDQMRADERLPHLLNVPAVVHFLSCEPLLSAVNLNLAKCHNGHGWVTPVLVNNDKDHGCPMCGTYVTSTSGVFYNRRGVDWVICGGESGTGARPLHFEWVRSLRDQCVAAGVPFFFKQWGEWTPNTREVFRDDYLHDQVEMAKVGKKLAGRTLDGRTWDEMPEVSRGL